MFTTSLTIYAINGESLNGKIIGINKYSTDIVWIKTENAVAVGELIFKKCLKNFSLKFFAKKLRFKRIQFNKRHVQRFGRAETRLYAIG
jgi:hypothetical protein